MQPFRIFAMSAALAGCLPALQAGDLVLVAGGQDAAEPVAALQAQLHAPFAVDFDRQGTLYFCEMTGHRVRAINAAGMLTTIAGTGAKGDTGDGGPARAATFNGMHHLAVAPTGILYVADTWNNRIRQIDPANPTIAPFAGTGRKGFAGDGGPAKEAEFGGIYCLALSPNGERMYLADLDNRRIRAIELATGTVTTVAGNGKSGAPQDGADAQKSPLLDPRAVAADDQGNVYILERKGNALRVVDREGRIRTVIGPEVKNLRDEQGRPPSPLKGPKHLCVDLEGNVLIADSDNHVIRKYLPGKNQLVRIAGTGKAGAAGLGGPPLEAQLNQPHGVYVHPSGAIYISDSSNDRIVKINP